MQAWRSSVQRLRVQRSQPSPGPPKQSNRQRRFTQEVSALWASRPVGQPRASQRWVHSNMQENFLIPDSQRRMQSWAHCPTFTQFNPEGAARSAGRGVGQAR